MTPRSLILAIDASPKRLGWAAVDYETAELVTSGVEHTTWDDVDDGLSDLITAAGIREAIRAAIGSPKA